MVAKESSILAQRGLYVDAIDELIGEARRRAEEVEEEVEELGPLNSPYSEDSDAGAKSRGSSPQPSIEAVIRKEEDEMRISDPVVTLGEESGPDHKCPELSGSSKAKPSRSVMDYRSTCTAAYAEQEFALPVQERHVSQGNSSEDAFVTNRETSTSKLSSGIEVSEIVVKGSKDHSANSGLRSSSIKAQLEVFKVMCRKRQPSLAIKFSATKKHSDAVRMRLSLGPKIFQTAQAYPSQDLALQDIISQATQHLRTHEVTDVTRDLADTISYHVNLGRPEPQPVTRIGFIPGVGFLGKVIFRGKTYHSDGASSTADEAKQILLEKVLNILLENPRVMSEEIVAPPEQNRLRAGQPACRANIVPKTLSSSGSAVEDDHSKTSVMIYRPEPAASQVMTCSTDRKMPSDLENASLYQARSPVSQDGHGKQSGAAPSSQDRPVLHRGHELANQHTVVRLPQSRPISKILKSTAGTIVVANASSTPQKSSATVATNVDPEQANSLYDHAFSRFNRKVQDIYGAEPLFHDIFNAYTRDANKYGCSIIFPRSRKVFGDTRARFPNERRARSAAIKEAYEWLVNNEITERENWSYDSTNSSRPRIDQHKSLMVDRLPAAANSLIDSSAPGCLSSLVQKEFRTNPVFDIQKDTHAGSTTYVGSVGFQLASEYKVIGDPAARYPCISTAKCAIAVLALDFLKALPGKNHVKSSRKSSTTMTPKPQVVAVARNGLPNSPRHALICIRNSQGAVGDVNEICTRLYQQLPKWRPQTGAQPHHGTAKHFCSVVLPRNEQLFGGTSTAFGSDKDAKRWAAELALEYLKTIIRVRYTSNQPMSQLIKKQDLIDELTEMVWKQYKTKPEWTNQRRRGQDGMVAFSCTVQIPGRQQPFGDSYERFHDEQEAKTAAASQAVAYLKESLIAAKSSTAASRRRSRSSPPRDRPTRSSDVYDRPAFQRRRIDRSDESDRLIPGADYHHGRSREFRTGDHYDGAGREPRSRDHYAGEGREPRSGDHYEGSARQYRGGDQREHSTRRIAETPRGFSGALGTAVLAKRKREPAGLTSPRVYPRAPDKIQDQTASRRSHAAPPVLGQTSKIWSAQECERAKRQKLDRETDRGPANVAESRKRTLLGQTSQAYDYRNDLYR